MSFFQTTLAGIAMAIAILAGPSAHAETVVPITPSASEAISVIGGAQTQPAHATPRPGPVTTFSGVNGLGWMLGVNASGAEFGGGIGTRGRDYTYPNHGELDYYASKGERVVRLPFLIERLQRTQGGALDVGELAAIMDIVSYNAGKGVYTVLDPHNYGYAFGQKLLAGPSADLFANFWAKLAAACKDAPFAIFGLMNEPHDQTAAEWLGPVNAAIAAIRAAGAKQVILVPGTSWTGAWRWVSSGNASDMAAHVVDPANNFAFEVHQYFDGDGSGTNFGPITDTSLGPSRLAVATAWAKSTGHKLFLAEFGVPSDAASVRVLDRALAFMAANKDVWIGGTIWAAGPWWGGYPQSVEPSNGVDKPQMTVLAKHV